MAAASHGSQGLMQTRDEAEQGGLGEQPSGHRLDHGRSALERDHLSTQQVHDWSYPDSVDRLWLSPPALG